MKGEVKTWWRQQNGDFLPEGQITAKNVHITSLKDGQWSQPMAPFSLGRAFDVIADAIASGKAPKDAYRLTPAKESGKILDRKGKTIREPKVAPERRAKEEVEEIEQENEMSKEKKAAKKAVKKEGAVKVGGLFQANSALAYLYEMFENEKPQKRDKLFADKKLGSDQQKREWRLRRFREAGEKSGLFTLIYDREAGTHQLKFGKAKPAKAAVAKKEVKAAKSAKKVNGKDTSDEKSESAASTKQAQKLVLRTLQSAGEWTKNKVVEHLKKQDIPAEDALAAIKEEIKLGSVSNEDGVLSLAF